MPLKNYGIHSGINLQNMKHTVYVSKIQRTGKSVLNNNVNFTVLTDYFEQLLNLKTN